MGCLVVLFSLFVPRLVIDVLWLFGGDYLGAAYGSWLWPTLGFFLLPTTTIAYAIAVNDLSSTSAIAGTDVSPSGAIVIVLAVLIDVGVIGGGARSRKRD